MQEAPIIKPTGLKPLSPKPDGSGGSKSSKSSGFVFGANLADRVVLPPPSPTKDEGTNDTDAKTKINTDSDEPTPDQIDDDRKATTSTNDTGPNSTTRSSSKPDIANTTTTTSTPTSTSTTTTTSTSTSTSTSNSTSTSFASFASSRNTFSNLSASNFSTFSSAASSSATAFQTPNKSNTESDDDKLKTSALKRKFDAITGEEDEQTVLQTPVKLFVWNLDSSTWAEKGRGLLKLNDPKNESSSKKDVHKKENEDAEETTPNVTNEFPRLIMRISGTLRIILNVAINPEHFKIIGTYEDDKSTVFRFSDSRDLYAVSGSAKDVAVFRRAVEWRLHTRASREKEPNSS